ncbi:helix-turn-helix transcriptional regulator [Morganella morganii]|nr:helix-turn-helix transcriptional regulator [Morganella morganii]MBT0375321.1 helix-turn-helix transcriptional regulator [Morganella morganii subsp. morganii]MBT0406967.1 helix-turn-helix transcriptional regulator [Morganella morganii subsp. morganii]MBT0504759.1 helix-turn-helix transcriptional regulator [Morganella morganii subsp. morganii]QWM12443.1 helix-turn-helix transcriptional regulator [Morganella morganii subsp. morganii]
MTILDVVDRLLPMVDIPKYKSFADRLVQRMTDVGVDIKQLSEGVGVTYEMARRYTLGSAKPRDDKMERVAEVVQSTPVYLDYGVRADGTVDKMATDTVTVRQIEAFASAGNGYINNPFPEVIRSIEIPQDRIYEMFGRRTLEGVVIINADGDSMTPTLNPKDLLFIDTKVGQFTGDGIYVFNFEGSTFIKRLQKVKGRKLAVISDNDFYPPFHIEEHEMHELYFHGKLLISIPMNIKYFS